MISGRFRTNKCALSSLAAAVRSSNLALPSADIALSQKVYLHELPGILPGSLLSTEEKCALQMLLSAHCKRSCNQNQASGCDMAANEKCVTLMRTLGFMSHGYFAHMIQTGGCCNGIGNIVMPARKSVQTHCGWLINLHAIFQAQCHDLSF